MARLKDFYYETVVEAMTKKFGYKNVMEVPKLEKIEIGRASCRERVSA